MPVPLSQMWTVVKYVFTQKLLGTKRYPLVLMLEPLMRCNLACGGCGKIQHPAAVLRRQLTPQQCFRAAEECGAPVISLPGGEPLLHPQIDEIVAGLIERGRFVYLCTNAIKLREWLPKFKPHHQLAFSVHLDGPREEHDVAVAREGIYDIAVDAIRAALDAGFRVTTNSTLFTGANPARIRGFFDELMRLGVEGMMISPGYPYAKAPDQDHFLERDRTIALFRSLLEDADPTWRFNHTPLFLDFLQGRYQLECTPWGSPTYNIFGWQKPCYLLDEGYCESYQELMDSTEWDNYGQASGNPKCANCMVHCGFEPSAVSATFGTLNGFVRTVQLSLGMGTTSRPERTPELVPEPAR